MIEGFIMTDFEFFEMASGEFLTESFPSEAVLWDRQSLAEFCDEYICEEYEGFTGEHILQKIEHVSDMMKTAYQIAKNRG
jgi:hypothetical protein